MGIPDVLSYAYHVAKIVWPALAVLAALLQAFLVWQQRREAKSSTAEIKALENTLRPLRERIECNETRIAEYEQTVSNNVDRVDTIDRRVETMESNHVAAIAAMAKKLDNVQKRLEEIEHRKPERPESYRDIGTQSGGDEKSVGIQTQPTVRSSIAAPGQRRFESSTAASRARGLQ
ncbi:hypothetical protein FB567DRAFT_593699 [Paraphoma chrysanthemicola]|uniref:Uncharacterized protein n=1 Tax=Paraphoma chrysanthemicola TaxID=798071 RepID=A0A8K0R2M1_9PLEO|nr:hypothetical protein FB567DRAFT_593699 [Paraphoma chrysanthemicola]